MEFYSNYGYIIKKTKKDAKNTSKRIIKCGCPEGIDFFCYLRSGNSKDQNDFCFYR